jgi:hypothetical protein
MMPQRFGCAEARVVRDRVDRNIRCFKQILRAAYSQPDQPFDRRRAGRGAEAAREGAHAHRSAIGEHLDGDVFA